jgi:hypothetical protein
LIARENMRDRDHWNPTDEELEKLAEFYRQLDEKLGHPADGDE